MITVVTAVFNLTPYLTSAGINLPALLVFCFLWGMGGSLISLALSRKMAKWSMGVKLIGEHDGSREYQELRQLVHRVARKAGIQKMPQVGVYQADELNAFATGPTKNKALVAFSTGLLNNMNYQQIEGVVGHEIAHIKNGDMVTMTLLQGVVNTFVMFLARVIAQAVVSQRGGGNNGGSSFFLYWVVVIVLEMVFMLLGSIIVSGFSRYREYRADAGGADLVGRESMRSALVALMETKDYNLSVMSKKGDLNNFKIFGGTKNILMQLFSTHPPLKDRIERLDGV